MKNLRIIVLVLAALASSASYADGTVISEQELTAQVHANNLSCMSGIPGNFPVSLRISLPTSYGSSSFVSPSALMLQNTDTVTFEGKADETCDQYADILNHEGPLDVSIKKVITESSQFREDLKACQRNVYEELTVVLGRITLVGQSAFVILPAPASDCVAPGK